MNETGKEQEIIVCSYETARDLYDSFPVDHMVMVPEDIVSFGEVVTLTKNALTEFLRECPHEVRIV